MRSGSWGQRGADSRGATGPVARRYYPNGISSEVGTRHLCRSDRLSSSRRPDWRARLICAGQYPKTPSYAKRTKRCWIFFTSTRAPGPRLRLLAHAAALVRAESFGRGAGAAGYSPGVVPLPMRERTGKIIAPHGLPAQDHTPPGLEEMLCSANTRGPPDVRSGQRRRQGIGWKTRIGVQDREGDVKTRLNRSPARQAKKKRSGSASDRFEWRIRKGFSDSAKIDAVAVHPARRPLGPAPRHGPTAAAPFARQMEMAALVIPAALSDGIEKTLPTKDSHLC